jgi:hypothetical protein
LTTEDLKKSSRYISDLGVNQALMRVQGNTIERMDAELDLYINREEESGAQQLEAATQKFALE